MGYVNGKKVATMGYRALNKVNFENRLSFEQTQLEHINVKRFEVSVQIVCICIF